MCYLFDWKDFIHEIENKFDLERKVKYYHKFFTNWCYKRTWTLIVWGVEKKLKTKVQTIKTKYGKYGRLIMQ